MSKQDEILQVYNSIREYCETYNIPQENLLNILEDQKVLPMIRGKATEYIGAAVLLHTLDARDWSVEKLNLNPQPGAADEDVSITFRRTGIRLKVEIKNAVRGSFKMKTHITPTPHFRVKCHKSRSHMSRKTNDRYLVNDFDLLLCNISNSIFRSKSLDRGLPLISDTDSVKWLKKHYAVTTDDELRRCSYDDWRICLPNDIVDKNGVIPRTPKRLMTNGPHWLCLSALSSKLRTLINEKKL